MDERKSVGKQLGLCSDSDTDFVRATTACNSKNKTLDVMQLGDEVATGLGVHVQKESAFFFFIAALLAALATAVAGNIAFLGLLGPQLAKRLVGTKHKWQIPVGACISAVILILADAISRNLFSPIEIPVGITVSVLGVPYFIYLMMKEK